MITNKTKPSIMALNKGIKRSIDYLTSDEQVDIKSIIQDIRMGRFYLEIVDEELRANKKIVLAAVNYDARNLEFASADLKVDRDVVIASIRGSVLCCDHSPLVYAIGLQDDDMTATTAIVNNPRALDHVSERLRKHFLFLNNLFINCYHYNLSDYVPKLDHSQIAYFRGIHRCDFGDELKSIDDHYRMYYNMFLKILFTTEIIDRFIKSKKIYGIKLIIYLKMTMIRPYRRIIYNAILES